MSLFRRKRKEDDEPVDLESIRQADDLFQGIADRLGGEFDGWEASV